MVLYMAASSSLADELFGFQGPSESLLQYQRHPCCIDFQLEHPLVSTSSLSYSMMPERYCAINHPSPPRSRRPSSSWISAASSENIPICTSCCLLNLQIGQLTHRVGEHRVEAMAWPGRDTFRKPAVPQRDHAVYYPILSFTQPQSDILGGYCQTLRYTSSLCPQNYGSLPGPPA
jgi:hypothetical protein